MRALFRQLDRARDPSRAGHARGSSGRSRLQAITFSGPGSEIDIRRAEGSSVEVRSGARSLRSLLPPASEDALMREELSILETDPVFDSVIGA